MHQFDLILILVLTKATLLLLCGFACLRFARRTTPAFRHLICFSAVGGTLAVLFTLLIPEPVFVVRLPSIAGSVITGRATSGGWPPAEFVIAIWACGFALVLTRFAIGYTRLLRVRRSASVTGPGIFMAEVSVPLVTGIFRPVILMPPDSEGWPEARRTAALRHEQAHVERRDPCTNFLCVVACAIYWFHPLIWILVRRLRVEQETACDDAVLQSGFDRTEYAEALVDAARDGKDCWLVSCPMADGTEVKARVIHVLSFTAARPASDTFGRRGLLVILAAALVALGATGAERIYRVGGAVTPPGVLEQVQPAYTPSAMKAEIQGKVRLAMVISPDGFAHNVEVVQGLDAGLDRNAVQAMAHWRFRPGMRDGRPVATRARVDVNFRLR